MNSSLSQMLEKETEMVTDSDFNMRPDKEEPLAEEPADDDQEDVMLPPPEEAPAYDGASLVQRVKFIPVRLDQRERKELRLVEAALNVSEYTDKVDVLTYGSKAQRIHKQLKDVCAILSGLLVASDYKQGQRIIAQKDFGENKDWFQSVFEIARRYKVMNPDRMRSDYGKMVHLLQDSVMGEIQDLLGFSLCEPLHTVYSTLEEADALGVFEDKYVGLAVMQINPKGKSRNQIQREIKQKEKAVEQIAETHCNKNISREGIRQCLYSIGDNNAFLAYNKDPVEKVIGYLKHYFNPQKQEEKFSLAISIGKNGARLSHDHHRQYSYVLHSLTLWKNILHDMFRLWYLAEEDLLSENNRYRLCDTGQGLNRVQAAPRVSKAMHAILHSTQMELGSWVGSSAIHLGDRAVPNALVFLDKYTQIPRFLNPLLLCIEGIGRMVDSNDAVRKLVKEQFGSVENCRKEILTDFFRHGFDGSGADNFFDAGSCIDGRLTSAWNWCNKLEKKRFYIIFLLCGFTGFDGDWKD